MIYDFELSFWKKWGKGVSGTPLSSQATGRTLECSLCCFLTCQQRLVQFLAMKLWFPVFTPFLQDSCCGDLSWGKMVIKNYVNISILSKQKCGTKPQAHPYPRNHQKKKKKKKNTLPFNGYKNITQKDHPTKGGGAPPSHHPSHPNIQTAAPWWFSLALWTEAPKHRTCGGWDLYDLRGTWSDDIMGCKGWDVSWETNEMVSKTNPSWWLNHPFEKYARQIGSFPKLGMKIRNLCNQHLESC